MYLFFDTETTGLPKSWKAPVTDLNNWPRMIQLAFLLFDESGEKISNGNYIIKPEGFTIPVQASKVHGITTRKALETGRPVLEVLLEFKSKVSDADFLVAHNMPFDEKIVGAEFLRQKMHNVIQGKRKICTMEKTTNFCKIMGPYGYKWPKLSELYYKLFHDNFEDVHDAASDIAATAKCFWELKKRKLI